MCTSVIVVKRLTGVFVTTGASAPTRRGSSNYDGGSSSQRLVIAAGLLLFLVLVLAATSLGSSARFGLGTLPHLSSRWRVPGTALAHLSAKLKSSATSWMSCVVSFSNVFSSLTP
jgi:hypothetical protein